MQHLFSMTRLIRTEISTLIGLLLKNDINYCVPAADVMEQYLEKTEALLEEIHQSMLGPWRAALDPKKVTDKGSKPFTNGAALREPIFYGGESAYSFQYRDLSPRKYGKDDEWLKTNKGFSIQTARDIVYSVGKLQEAKSIATLKALRKNPPEQWTVLPGFEFTVQEIAEQTNIDSAVVKKVLEAFSVPAGEKNIQFSVLHDFNIANAFPLICIREDAYILFQIYSLVESLYESPFYWVGDDKAYVSTAMRHRGLFTEEFAAERLALVFGRGNVYSNIDIFKSKSTRVGEIDVLVLFGDRAIVLQAKSKRLTLEARKGNDGQIRDDFKKSIQDSCDQGYACAKLLGDANYTLKDAHSREIAIPMALKQVYVLCAISDHYPALSFQARQFLKFDATDTTPPPVRLGLVYARRDDGDAGFTTQDA
ncbi:nuclease-related domain-containing protein [Undibacterium arcticum]